MHILLMRIASAGNQTTVSQIGPDELPPAYQQGMQNGVPMVTCRVCQAMIDISTKREQHVVKCNQCSEATVRISRATDIGCTYQPTLSTPSAHS